MKKLAFLPFFLGAALLLFAFNPVKTGNNPLALGEGAPLMHIKMQDVSGNAMNLREVNQENGMLVIFSCNTCPFVIKWEDRYNDLAAYCAQNNIGMALINSNEAKRSGDDSFAKMKEKAQKEGYNMHYLMDTNHELADAFGARTTPHVYLFNSSAKLAYRGLIDDNENKNDVNEQYLMDAMKNMVDGNTITPDVTKARGCSIKRVP